MLEFTNPLLIVGDDPEIDSVSKPNVVGSYALKDGDIEELGGG